MAGRSGMPNFKTDVNRMKTQKWAQASKANYGGDDWGGYDDYGDYEDEPPPPPRPTGLRQRGQGTANSSPEQANFASEQIPVSHVTPQQAAQPRVASQPQQRPRAGSFESGDDSFLVQRQQHTAPQHSRVASQPIAPRFNEPGLSHPQSGNANPALPPFARPSPSQQTSVPPAQAPNQTSQPATGAISPLNQPASGYMMGSSGGQTSPLDHAPEVIEGPYVGPGSARQQQQHRPLPRQDSREAPGMMQPSHTNLGQIPPGSSNVNSRPPPGMNPPFGASRPFGPGRNHSGTPPSHEGGRPYGPARNHSGTPPAHDGARPYGSMRNHSGTPPGHGPHMGREGTPPGPHGPHPGQRPRPPPSQQDYGPRKRPSQEHGMRKSPSQEFRPRPSQEFKPRQPTSQEFRPRPSPSQEFRPPPRKESLNTNQRPSPTSIGADSARETRPPMARQTSDHREPPAPQDAPTESESRPSASFVRPADIYRRMENERERERQSMDSGRPSLESIERGARSGNQGTGLSRNSQDSSREANQNTLLKPTLDTVAERKSEYGMDGFLAQDPTFAKALGAHVSTGNASLDAPSLPQFERLSSFNMADLMADSQEKQASQGPAVEDKGIVESAKEEVQPSAPGPVSVAARPDDLQHQPSSGFRSAVDRAFDGPTDNSTLSPTSGHGSQRSKESSSVSRSNTTDSTAGISPIMSRVPSAATAERRYREAESRMAAPEAIQEETSETGSPSSRPDSSTTLKAQQAAPITADVDQTRPASNDSNSLKGGYRRSMRPPSPGNTPAYLTGASARKAMEQHPHEGEIGVTSPVQDPREEAMAFESQRAGDLSTRESDIAAAMQTHDSPQSQAQTYENAETNARSNFMAAHPSAHLPPILSEPVMPSKETDSRSASPSKGRVRQLATKYNDIQTSRASSPTGSVASWASSNKGSPVGQDNGTPVAESAPTEVAPAIRTEEPQNPKSTAQKAADLAGLPRPTLPGGWVSYNPSEASEAHSAAPSVSDSYESANEQGHEPMTTSRLTTPKANREMSSESIDLAPSTVKKPLAGHTYPQPAENPMAALSAAGSALADSMKQIAGLGQGDSSAEDTRPRSDMRDLDDSSAQATPFSPDETIASASSAPSPPAKDPSRTTDPPRNSGYFSAATPLTIRKNEQTVGESTHRNSSTREPDSAHSAASDVFSLDPSASDTEADALRKDIVRSLSPPEGPQGGGKLTPIHERGSNLSSVLPQEYDAYWANHDNQTRSPKTTRFSNTSMGQTTPPEAPSSPEITEAPVTSRSARSSGVGASSVGTRSAGRPSIDSLSKPLPPDPAIKASLDSARERANSTERTGHGSSSGGPSKLSPLQTGSLDPVEMPASGSPRIRDTANQSLPGSPFTGRRRADTTPTSKGQPKPPSFREIMNMKGQRERISAFNAAKDQFGTQSTGLNDWVRSMVDRHPEHSNAVSAPMRPVAQTSGIAGSVRNKMPPGMAKFGRAGPSGTVPSANAESSSPGGAYLKDSPSVSKRQELLHQANAFGGKASKGAKGLLAKGRSRFRGVSSEKENKQSASPSRQRHASPSLPREAHADDSSSQEPLPAADQRADLVPDDGELTRSHRLNPAGNADSVEQRKDERKVEPQPINKHGPSTAEPVVRAQDGRLTLAAQPDTHASDSQHVAEEHPDVSQPGLEPVGSFSPANDPNAGSQDNTSVLHARNAERSQNVSYPPRQALEIIEGPYRAPTKDDEKRRTFPGYSTEKIAVVDDDNIDMRGSNDRSDEPIDLPKMSQTAINAANQLPRASLTQERGQPSHPSPRDAFTESDYSQTNIPATTASHSAHHAPKESLESNMQVYENCRESIEPTGQAESRSRFSWGPKVPNKPGKSPTRMSPAAWAMRARSRSHGRKNSMESPPPRPGETPPPPLPSNPPVYWPPRKSSVDLTRSPPSLENAPPVPRPGETPAPPQPSNPPVSWPPRKSSVDLRRSPPVENARPLPREVSHWSSSSVAVAPEAIPDVPVAGGPMPQDRPLEKPLPQMPPNLQTGLPVSAAHSQEIRSPQATSPPIPAPTAAFSPIDPGKRHYAQPPPPQPSVPSTPLPSKSAGTLKSRNRLSKRYSAQVPPPKPMIESPQTPDPSKKKRSSMFGSILRRSDTIKEDEPAPLPVTSKVQPNKLKKANSKLSSKHEFVEDSAPPPMPMPVYSQGSLPRPPTAVPRLPDVDTYSIVRGQGGPPDRTSRSQSRTRHDAENYRGDQGFSSQVSPDADARFSGPQDRRARHIDYLQRQELFPSRQRTPVQPGAYETRPAIYEAPNARTPPPPPQQHIVPDLPAAETPPPPELPNAYAPAPAANAHALHPPAIQRSPSGASSVYTTGIDERMQAQPSNASGRYRKAGDYGVKPLTGAYVGYGGNPYDDGESRREANYDTQADEGHGDGARGAVVEADGWERAVESDGRTQAGSAWDLVRE
ncbi:MAG: hypothetical protein Q9162_003527 [Coniocarpon cinnabarinum]